MSATAASSNSGDSSSPTTARNKHSKNSNYEGKSYSPPSIDITKEEFNRISDALKKEEFRKLFLDYCEEIQDPENRKRYEDEITQLEAERGVDIKFLNPEPGFVIKTSIDGLDKCFVNVAKNVNVAKPTNGIGINPETGDRGLNWSIPLAQAPPRDDFDAQGKCCRVFDVIFNPDALYLAERNKPFRQCLIDTALDAVEREFKVKLDRNNLKFPKMKFKGLARATVIRTLSKNPSSESTEPHPFENIFPPRPNADGGKPKVVPAKNAASSKANHKTTGCDFTTPKYIIKYRRDVDLAEFTDELDAKLNVTVPQEFVIEIELPLLKSTADCQLDVTPNSVYFLSERSGARYRLKLDLLYTVNDNKGSARFDTDKRRLCITLPVVQNNAMEQRNMHDALLHLNREDSGVESDIREDVSSNNRESPIEELSDSVDINKEEETSSPSTTSFDTLELEEYDATLSTKTFLKNSIQYQFPKRFDCNILDNVISFVLHVRNVQSESIAILQFANNLHLQFSCVGGGYFPAHYAFYMRLPSDTEVEIISAEAEAWENNVVLNLNLSSTGENLESYLAGLDSMDLKEYTVQEKFQLATARDEIKTPPVTPILLSSSLDISVERSECDRSVEIEIKPREQQSTGTANTTEDEEGQRSDTTLKKWNKKQKKKNKKRRSFSESTCDDFNKAFQLKKQEAELIPNSLTNNVKDNKSNDEQGNEVISATASSSVAVPNAMNAQKRKQRSYSESRDSVVSSSAGSSNLTSGFKGILKRFSRYEPRPSISDSCSSIDDCSSYSCSVDTGFSNSFSFPKSFSDIPEENNVEGLSESCKKTVRFNEVIKKQIFRHDSSILGQRKKNQKRRDRKQRAIQRRLSEGDSADYEDNNKVVEPIKNQRNNKNDKNGRTDFELDGKMIQKRDSKAETVRGRLESESSCDLDIAKNAMMFEMEM